MPHIPRRIAFELNASVLTPGEGPTPAPRIIWIACLPPICRTTSISCNRGLESAREDEAERYFELLLNVMIAAQVAFAEYRTVLTKEPDVKSEHRPGRMYSRTRYRTDT